MQVGFNLLLWTTHLTEEHLPLLERLKAAGYDGVEVPVFEGDPEHYATTAARLKDVGLRSTVVGIVQDAAHNPISPDADARAAGREYLCWLVDCCEALGAEVLCGPFYQPLAEFSGTGPTEEEWGHLVSAHQDMARYARAAGVTLAVEPLNRFECYALNTGADADRLTRDVGEAGYGWLYDTFHANIEEKDPVGVISDHAETITHVHVSENDRGTPGRGHIDFAAAFRALKAAGYDGWLTVEAFGQALPDLAAATKVWRPLFESEEHVYGEAVQMIRDVWSEV